MNKRQHKAQFLYHLSCSTARLLQYEEEFFNHVCSLEKKANRYPKIDMSNSFLFWENLEK